MSEFVGAVLTKAGEWAEAAARRNQLRDLSDRAGRIAYHEWFVQRAREFGGINPKNRVQIETEAKAKSLEARRAVYLAAGYTVCTGHEQVLTEAANAKLAAARAKFQKSKSAAVKVAQMNAIDAVYADGASWVEGKPCDRLVTPGFSGCPDHA